LSSTATTMGSFSLSDDSTHRRGSETYPVQSRANFATNTPDVVLFGQLVSRFQNARAALRHVLRSEIVHQIEQQQAVEPFIDELLRVTLNSHTANRVDDAIDILSHTGGALTGYVREALVQKQKAPEAGNEDFWYVLIRALSRAISSRQVVPVLESFAGFAFPPIREAIAEALSEMDDSESLRLLRVLASDSSDVVRRVAIEGLAERSA
jgi:hypothetical protein